MTVHELEGSRWGWDELASLKSLSAVMFTTGCTIIKLIELCVEQKNSTGMNCKQCLQQTF